MFVGNDAVFEVDRQFVRAVLRFALEQLFDLLFGQTSRQVPVFEGVIIKNIGEKVKVLKSDDKWYGVTYKEDKQSVVDALAEYTKKGLYNKF